MRYRGGGTHFPWDGWIGQIFLCRDNLSVVVGGENIAGGSAEVRIRMSGMRVLSHLLVIAGAIRREIACPLPQDLA
jgi:hypothetical protein